MTIVHNAHGDYSLGPIIMASKLGGNLNLTIYIETGSTNLTGLDPELSKGGGFFSSISLGPRPIVKKGGSFEPKEHRH